MSVVEHNLYLDRKINGARHIHFSTFLGNVCKLHHSMCVVSTYFLSYSRPVSTSMSPWVKGLGYGGSLLNICIHSVVHIADGTGQLFVARHLS